jgi:TatD family-associated radical SAM protein
MEEQTIAYTLGESIYLNVTNRCTNDCLFCIRRTREGLGTYDLWLVKEPELDELLEAAGDISRYREVVFCGYGEPLVRADLVIKAAGAMKKQGAVIRINTNGQADLINGRSIAPELAGLVDVVSISLNTADSRQYMEICQPLYGRPAYEALLKFTEECKKYIPRVILTAVTWPGVDMDKCREVARKLNVDFRMRRLTGTFTCERVSPV